MESASLVQLVQAGNEAAVLKLSQRESEESAASDITSGEFGDRGTKSPLHCAAHCGRAGILRIFLSYKVDPNPVDDAFNTPLHFAVSAGHARAAHLLLKAGAKVRAGNGFGKTPILLAQEQAWDAPYVKSGKAEIRRMLEGSFDSYDSLPPEPAVVGAAEPAQARGGRRDSVPDGILTGSEQPHVAPAQGGRRASAPSVVNCAAQADEPDLLAELVKTGNLGTVQTRLDEILAARGPEAVRAEVMNCEEGLHDTRVAQSALHVAARRGYADMLRTLLSTKASPDVTNDQWNTPLHLAAESGKANTVEVLLEAGADPMIRNSFGRTAEEFAFVKSFDPQEVAQGKSLIQKMLRKMIKL